MRYSTLAFLAVQAISVFAADEATLEKEIPNLPNLKVSVSTSFPDSEVFGVKLINGHATRALLTFTNNEALPISISLIGGSLSSLSSSTAEGVIRNLTSTRYDVDVLAGEKQAVPYTFTTDLHPQDLRLALLAVLTSKGGEGEVYQVAAFNETISVVEPATSFLDPQIIFLYVFLLTVFLSTLYFIYKTWIEALFPQTKRGGKGGERAKKSLSGNKAAVDPKDQISVIGADGPAVTTGALAQKAYDESWIPEHHLNRPAAKRVKSGASKVKRTVAE